MGYVGDECDFQPVWVMNWASILAILMNNVQFLYPSLEVGVFILEETTFSSLSIRPSTKAPHNLCKGQAMDISLSKE